MRIVNVTAFRRAFSYASSAKGGVELDPGQEGPEIPVTRVFENPLVMKDIDAGVAMLRLSDTDRGMLTNVLSEADRKVVVAKPPPRPVKPKPKKAKAKPAEVAAAAAKPKGPAAEPVSEAKVRSGGMSLADLQKGNTAMTPEELKARKLKQISTLMDGPMGSAINGGS